MTEIAVNTKNLATSQKKNQQVKVLVVANSEQGVFIDALTTYRIDFEICNSTDVFNLYSSNFNRVLVINQNIKVAVELKQKYPQVAVMAINGGAKDFQPLINVVYGPEDYDSHTYIGVSDLITKIIDPPPRNEILLRFKQQNYNSKTYEIVPEAWKKYSLDPNLPALGDIYNLFAGYSEFYLDYCQKWLAEINQKMFPIEFNYKPGKRKIKIIKFAPETNLFRGLTIFKDEDEIELISSHGRICSGVIEKICEGEIYLKLISPCSRKRINEVQNYRKNIDKDAQILNIQKTILQSQTELYNPYPDYKKWCQEHRISNFFQINSCPTTTYEIIKPYPPLASLINQVSDSHNRRSTKLIKATDLEFDKESGKIINDYSQQKAFLNMISPQPLSLIMGSAGSGKTSVTATAVKHFWQQNKVILVTSHSNKGLDKLLSKIITNVNNDCIFHLGNNLSAIQPELHYLHRSIRYPDDRSNANLAEAREISKLKAAGKGIILACTINSLIMDHTIETLNFQPEITFIDEATRNLFFELAPILTATKDKIIFIGDPEQLSNFPFTPEMKNQLRQFSPTKNWLVQTQTPFIRAAINDKNKLIDYFNRSLFEALSLAITPTFLTHNRRSKIRISLMVSRLFYNWKVLPGRFNFNDSGQVVFYDYNNWLDKPKGTSHINPAEANLIVEEFFKAAKHLLKNDQPITEVVIMTPYKGQNRLVKDKIRKALYFRADLNDIKESIMGLKYPVNPDKPDTNKDINKRINDFIDQLVITVDAMQGDERRIIILGLTRNNPEHEIGFNHEINRLNVALSRAQDLLIIIGSSNNFIKSGYPEIIKIFRGLKKYVQKHGKYISNP